MLGKLFDFFKELKRRNVIKATISYLIVSWVVIQVVSVIGSIFFIPSWISKGVFILLIIGLPFWLIFNWIYELTPDGIKKTINITTENSKTLKKIDKKLNVVIITFLSIAICLLIVDRFRITEKVNTQNSVLQYQNENRHSIAVLPFIDLSPKKDQEYFSDGMSEELLNLLANIDSLKVTSRTSAFSFKNTKLDIPAIAKKLNVAYILEGSVRKSEDQLRITVQLIKVEGDQHIWSETWDRKLINIFDIQDEIALAVVNYLKINLLDEEVPKVIKTNSDAYALFLKAKHSFNLSNKKELINAENYIKESLKIDASYPPSWALLADIYVLQGNYSIKSIDEVSKLAIMAAEESVKIDSTYALGYAILGDIALAYEWNYKKAKMLNEKALQLEPNNPHILNLSSALALSLGELGKAINYQEYSVILDPLNSVAIYGLGVSYFNAKRYDDAEKKLNEALKINQNLWSGNYYLSKIIMYKGNIEESLIITERDYDLGWKLNNKAMLYYLKDDQEKSDFYTNQIIELYPEEMAFQIAEIYAFTSKVDLAFLWLDKSYEYRDIGLNEFLIDPDLENLRDDPRWELLKEKMGL